MITNELDHPEFQHHLSFLRLTESWQAKRGELTPDVAEAMRDMVKFGLLHVIITAMLRRFWLGDAWEDLCREAAISMKEWGYVMPRTPFYPEWFNGLLQALSEPPEGGSS